MAKYKYYVVWEGRARGIFDSWEECKEQVDNFKGAKYKSFDSLEAATEAFRNAPDDYFDVIRKIGEHSRDKLSAPILPPSVIADSLSVDAACSGNPGKMEYRGVDTKSGIELFHVGPLEQGTNNIGEFLALVHGLAYLQQRDSDIPIYSDSRNAILWIKQKKMQDQTSPQRSQCSHIRPYRTGRTLATYSRLCQCHHQMGYREVGRNPRRFRQKVKGTVTRYKQKNPVIFRIQ